MVSDQASGTDTTTSLRAMLAAARDRGFVGRDTELSALAASWRGTSEVRVHVVHGPGGIGKTTLLDALARDVDRAGGRAVYLDAREVSCASTAVTRAVAERTSAAGPAPPTGPEVLLVDGYELLEPLDRWFREHFLPSRPVGSVTVLASRSAPPAGWRLDPGWQRLARVHELTALAPEETEELLARLGVPEQHRPAVARLGRGHPLVLAMLAEAAGHDLVPERLDQAPDVVGALCRLIIDDVPDAAHRTGLATCAHAVRMTQDLLQRTVGTRAGEVWAWLESRPYVRRGAVGLFLHDVVRELFEAEFAHRAPGAYRDLHMVVKGHFNERLLDPAEPHPDRAAAELLLLHRKGPLAREAQTLREGGLLPVTRAGPDDHPGILRLTAECEGPESAELARRWIEAQPSAIYRVRSDAGVDAFGMHLYLEAADAPPAHDPAPAHPGPSDPVVTAVLDAVERRGPLRPGERIHVNRFSATSGASRHDPMLLLVNGVSCILEWVRRPAAWTVTVTVDPEHYGPYFAYLGMAPMVALDYFGQPLVAYGWDRRRFPLHALFDMLSRRELSGESGPPPAEMLRPAPLARAHFESAARAALLELGRHDRLARSPLLGSSLVDPGATDPVAGLRATLQAAIADLGHERRGAEHRRVLERSYLHGVPSQEAAAELLELPFSTYRRHLAQAQQRLVEVLWAIEIGTRPRPAPGGRKVSSE